MLFNNSLDNVTVIFLMCNAKCTVESGNDELFVLGISLLFVIDVEEKDKDTILKLLTQ